MANEKIVATMIYYYDSENIKDDRLRFRRAVNLVRSLMVWVTLWYRDR
jgi:hypothetical protein